MIRSEWEGKTVLITGTTGFVGKAVLEGLLRTCNVSKIYVLIRPRRGKNPAQRCKALLEGPIFNRLNNEKPDELKKVGYISGSLDAEGDVLGFSEEDLAIITDTVDVILHVGGSIKFDMPVHQAMRTNTYAALNLLRIAQNSKNVKCFLYCSTAYTGPPGHYMEGPPPVPDFVQRVSDPSELTEAEIQQLDEMYPNTYSLSKSLAEHFIWKQHGSMPVVIAKPAIVMPALRDPYPGWVDSFDGGVGCFVAVAFGVAHRIPIRANDVMDCVPVDTCVNVILGATSATLRKHKFRVFPANTFAPLSERNGEGPITFWHIGSSSDNPFRSRSIYRQVAHFFRQYPMKQQVVKPFTIFVGDTAVFESLRAVQSAAVQSLADALPKSELMKNLNLVQSKVDIIAEAMLHFIFHNWFFVNQNSRELEEALDPEEHEMFPMTVRGSPEASTAVFCYGIAKYIADTPNLPSAEDTCYRHLQSWAKHRRRMKRITAYMPGCITSSL